MCVGVNVCIMPLVTVVLVVVNGRFVVVVIKNKTNLTALQAEYKSVYIYILLYTAYI